MEQSRAVALAAALAVCAIGWTHQALAQAYPSKPVRIVIPLSPGGTTDVPGRILTQRLSDAMGQQFFVENRTGAGGTIGAEGVAKAVPDGYTLLLTATPHVITANLYKNLAYNALTDFTPVARMATGPYVLMVHPSLGVNSVKELVALAKSKPGSIDFASSGNGSAQHLVGALFSTMAGVQLNHIPYKGSGPATADMLAGMVKVGFPGTPIAIPHSKSGRLKALGVTTPQRSAQMPDVPTIAEAGVPGFEAVVWTGLIAPAKTPPEVVARLNAEINKLLRSQDVQQQLSSSGVDAAPLTPAEFGSYLRDEFDKWGKVVRDSGATVN